ncbi:MAG: linear amide C-N hydrolase [Ignavibacteria bacterium]|jgi:choloylglycine hydrolase
MKKNFLTFLLMFIFFIYESNACVTFVINTEDSLFFGWNYEFDCGSGFLIINKRGLVKTSFLRPDEIPIKWISKYGSITFNQWGKEFPSGGINEKGLVVTQATFLATQYPEKDIRPAISELQWIQYQLDNYSNVQEVINSDKLIRITKNSVPLHYMICDKEGNTAIIEFIDGRMVFYQNDELLYRVMGNESYQSSLLEISKYKGLGGNQEIPSKSTDTKYANSIIASDYVKKYSKSYNIVEYSFDILSHSSEPARTQWSLLFDIKNDRIYFRSLQNADIKSINLSDFNFECKTQVKILDISAHQTSDFINYTNKINAYYINKAYNDPSISWINEVIPIEANNHKIEYIKSIKCK